MDCDMLVSVNKGRGRLAPPSVRCHWRQLFVRSPTKDLGGFRHLVLGEDVVQDKIFPVSRGLRPDEANAEVAFRNAVTTTFFSSSASSFFFASAAFASAVVQP